MSVKFEIGFHASLTEEANDGLLDQEQLGYVVAANIAQDLLQTQSAVHFDNCNFAGAIDHIAAQWAVIDELGDHYADSALAAFGALLHTTQDFYAHSNWIELHEQVAPVPVWNQTLASLPAGIISGTWLLGFPKLCPSGTPSHSQLNKDSPKSKEGAKIVASGPNKGETLFDLAYATAFAATKVQYARFAKVKLGPLAREASGSDAVGEIIRTQQELRAVF